MSSHPVSLRFISISSNLCLGLPSSPFPLSFLHQNLHIYIYISHLSICATCSASQIFFDMNTHIVLGENYTSWRTLLYSFLQSTVTSSHLDSNTFPGTLSLSSSLISRHKISHSYNATNKTMDLHALCLYQHTGQWCRNWQIVTVSKWCTWFSMTLQSCEQLLITAVIRL